jgi:3-carboxy-cis,cis-muconate cycloisomerase
VFEAILTTDELLDATSDRAWLATMVEVEVALARAEADCGLIPADVAEMIAVRLAHPDVNLEELGRAARDSANPVVPLISMIAHGLPSEASAYLHYGATSQDILDTAAMLVVKRASRSILISCDSAAANAARLADEHRSTITVARTLLQHAVPSTFGLKAAGWCVSMIEARAFLASVVERRLVVELGGAGGTLAALGTAGPAVTARFAEIVGLGEPLLPWHTLRARIGELAGALAVAAGSAAKIAGDVALLMQSEIAEVVEPGGSSSTMPHKRNPAKSAEAIAAAHQANGFAATLLGVMRQEYERSVGMWQAEWSTLSALLRTAGGAVARVSEILSVLDVDRERMGQNLDAARGLVLAEEARLMLAEKLGQAPARVAVETAAARVRANGTTLHDELASNTDVAAVLGPTELERLTEPWHYLGATDVYIDRAIAAYRSASEAARSEGRVDNG